MSDQESALEISGTVYPLGRYMILAGLGRGGMAEVYLALSRGPSGFSKLVVLKLLREHLTEDEEFLRMFLAEARLAARLNHPNIVQTYEIGIEDGRHCIVMEYLEGRSFAEVETQVGYKAMPLNLGVRVVADTLAGLHHAHERCDAQGRPLNLVHRDVSPHNVFITWDGHVKVLDFGIAKAADDGANTKTGVFKGKLRYTAPERFLGEESDRRSDIFSVGVVLWQTITGRRLWSGLTDLALMQQLANGVPIPSARATNPEVPEALDRICAKALAVNPADRYQTALEMQDALEEFLSTESVGGTNRALGKFMLDLFGDTRERFQRVVDEQIRTAQAIPFDFETAASGSRIRAHELPMLGAERGTEDGPPSSKPLSSLSRIKALPVPTMVSATTQGSPDSVIVAEPAARKRTRHIVLALLGTAAAFVALTFALRSGHEAPVAPETVPPGAAPAAVTTPAATAADVAPAPASSAPTPLDPSATEGPPLGSGAAASKRVAPVVRSAPGPVRGRTAPASAPEARPAEPGAKREVDCSSPYYIDDKGMKKVRMECL